MYGIQDLLVVPFLISACLFLVRQFGGLGNGARGCHCGQARGCETGGAKAMPVTGERYDPSSTDATGAREQVAGTETSLRMHRVVQLGFGTGQEGAPMPSVAHTPATQ